MMKKPRAQTFGNDTSGIALTEGLITFPIMLLAIAVCVEFIFGMYQWNIASKAMHLAARRIAVSLPFTGGFGATFEFNPDLGGDLILPNAGTSVSCGAGAGTPCIQSAMDYLVGPHDRTQNVWPGLSSLYPQLDPQTIRITYEQNGLGFQGRPSGPVVTARLEFANAAFNLPILGVLLNLAGITLPPFRVSITTEDLRNCPFDVTPCAW